MYEQQIKKSEARNRNSPYYYLSNHRSELMGFAILWVVWFHSSVNLNFFPFGFLNSAFSFCKNIGYGGVDIFLLVSGIGIYMSLEKNNISQYIKNRIKRISPIWWTFLIISVLLGHFVFQVHFSKLEIIGFATYTGFWLNMSNQGNWYVYAIMLFYLVSPVFYSLIKNSNRRLLTFIVLIVATLIISVPFFENFKLIVFSRVPIYVTGMYIASSLNNMRIKKIHWIGILLFCITGFIVLWVFHRYYTEYLWPYGLWWYPFIVIAPSLSLLLAKLFDCIRKIAKPFLSILSILGKSSLEILLVSDYLFANFNKLNIIVFNIRITSIFVVIISLLIGIAFHYFIDSIIKNLPLHVNLWNKKY